MSVASIVALAPALVLSYNALNERVVKAESLVQVSVASCTRDHVVFAISNTGSRPAVVTSGRADLSDDGDKGVFRDLQIVREAAKAVDGDALVFEPVAVPASEMKIVSFSMIGADGQASAMPPSHDPPCRYLTRISIIGFGGKSSPYTGACECPH